MEDTDFDKGRDQQKVYINRKKSDHLAGENISKANDTAKDEFVKHFRLKNYISGSEIYDSLHSAAVKVTNAESVCSEKVCLGSTMFGTNFQAPTNDFRKPEIILEHAADFLNQYYSSIRRLNSASHEKRLQEVKNEIFASGIYNLTETELIYGAKLAWRNSARCIGRIQWSKLQVFDCRFVTTTSGMFEAICNHMKYATNRGNLRSAITIFPQRMGRGHDYRIWNHQLISYAGYRMNDGQIIGDPANVEFTELCLKIGWKSSGTPWDILPIVVSANGHDPDYFDLPRELVLEVPLVHPQFEWFADFNLRWYALPAVSNMLFDCGGIQFTATAFSGWYMSTEIGCRNLCDNKRLNVLEKVARNLRLDMQTTSSLWKDKALVEVNIAVLHSFQIKNVTIVDHHTASESFMKHYENETKLRNGCPADWIWIVPPMSASLTSVFHQEFALYKLKPSFEYQEHAHRVHLWNKSKHSTKNINKRRKFHFKQIARAVKFTSKLFGRALSRRIKATILYATETGKSEQYAKQLFELLAHAFNAQIYCTSKYDISSIEHEALLIIIASTFGNGDPPENGEEFAQGLYSMKLQEIVDGADFYTRVSSKSFIKANSSIERGVLDFKNENEADISNIGECFGPLSNVRFAVFGLGSSAYPNFCAFGNFLNKILGDLGGERLMEISYGDEMCGQEHSFSKWAPDIFKKSCEAFCLDTDEKISAALQADVTSVDRTRFVTQNTSESLCAQLSKYHNKNASKCIMESTAQNLHGQSDNRSTILVKILTNDHDISFQPGDHVGIFAENRLEIVNGILKCLTGVENPDEILQLQVLKEHHTSNGVSKSWETHEKLPTCSLRQLLTRFVDVTSPPSSQLLKLLANYCADKIDEESLTRLINDPSEYEDWRCLRCPNILEIFKNCPSCRPPAAALIAHLMPLQPRFYSISSSPAKYKDEIHLTVSVVRYIVNEDPGDIRYGVCSNYLEGLEKGNSVYLFVRKSNNFHLPRKLSEPIVLFGPGTGIAPYRSFWQHYEHLISTKPKVKIPKIWLFFGCRTKSLDLYFSEKQDMVKKGVLDRVYLALSRENNAKKTYVQDIARREAEALYYLLAKRRGHLYVCGDVTMAENVYTTIRDIVARIGNKSESEAEKFMLNLRDENRYHEDIFGITLRTAEIHNKFRATARIKMEYQTNKAVIVI